MNNSKLIYLDHAAATPLDERVLAEMLPYFSELFYNPSSPYEPAIKVRRCYEDAKSRIGRCIGAKSDELVMTAGATESINLAFNSVMGHVVTANIEHHAVLKSAQSREYTAVEASARGIVEPASVAAAIRPDTGLVSVALANNELGTIQPIREIALVIDQERARRKQAGNTQPIYLHCDASQGVGQLDIHTSRLGVDLLTINSGKIYGPKQMALLWTKPGVQLIPQIVGGGQERGLRSGTENVPNVIGFAKALELVTEHRKFETERLQKMRDALQARLEAAFPDAVVSGNQKRRLAGHLHISFPGIDAERVVFMLEADNVLVATGSACAANKGTRSHVLTAIGLKPEIADGSLRLTFGRLNRLEDIEIAAELIIAAITSEYKRMKR